MALCVTAATSFHRDYGGITALHHFIEVIFAGDRPVISSGCCVRMAIMHAAKVFVSYSHDSREHERRVRALADRLRAVGVDARMDKYESAPAEGWPMWMERQISNADFVLLICTETYRRRVEGREEQYKGRGVLWEAKTIYNLLYQGDRNALKVVPILLAGGQPSWIPLSLQGLAHYCVDELEGYEELCRRLTNQPRPIPRLGRRKPAPTVASQSNPVSAAIKRSPEIDDNDNGDGACFAASIERHMATLDRKVKKLTEEQLRVINQLRFLTRVRVSGIAGSGKTLVAAEKAIRLASAGLRTLFLCHNPMLARHVSALTQGAGVVVASFTDWAAALAGTASVDTSGWSKYEEPTPETLASAFDFVFTSADRYAAVIVDEGQDFREEW